MSEIPARRFICRCEEIDHDLAVQAIAEGAATLNDLKRRTRAGMGVCQGVYCLPEMAELLAATRGEDAAGFDPMTSRPPGRVLALGELADLFPGAGVD